MTRTRALIAAALALGSAAVVPAAQAQRYDDRDGSRYEQAYRGDAYHQQDYREDYRRGDDRRGGYRDAYGRPVYYQGGYARNAYADSGYAQYYDRGYHGYDRGYRPCRSGTTGTIIGALAGGLLGRAVDDRGDHAIGTILGAGAGALAGRAVERNGNQQYCR